MDITFTGVITKIATPEQVIDRKTNQPNGATRYLFLVEEQGQQYPDSVVVEIYDKASDGSAIVNAFQSLGVQNPLRVGTMGIFHIHLRGSIGISQKTGKEYAMNDAARLWKVEPAVAQQQVAPQFAQQAAPQAGFQPQPQAGFQQSAAPAYNPAAQVFAPRQPFPGQQSFGGYQTPQ